MKKKEEVDARKNTLLSLRRALKGLTLLETKCVDV